MLLKAFKRWLLKAFKGFFKAFKGFLEVFGGMPFEGFYRPLKGFAGWAYHYHPPQPPPGVIEVTPTNKRCSLIMP